jgi:hypothetical protein
MEDILQILLTHKKYFQLVDYLELQTCVELRTTQQNLWLVNI